MTTAAPATDSNTASAIPIDRRTTRKVTLASFVGTALENYDFYLYAYFAVFFAGPLFFSPLGGFGESLAAFLTIAVSFIARPLGAVVFGHLGDRIGRRRTLLWTIGLMGVATGLIGALPDFATAGWLGAVLLVVLRLLQGLSMGGEWGGAISLVTEHSPRRSRFFYAALPQLGSPVGSILAGVFFLALFATMPTVLGEWAWRLPFLTAFPLLAVSLYLRWSIDETPAFKGLVATDRRERIPFATLLRRQPVALLVGAGVALLGIGSYYLMNTYTTGYGVAVLGFDEMQLLTATTIGALLQLVTIPLFGALAVRIGASRVIAIGAVGTAAIALPMYWLLQTASFPVLVGMMIIGGILPTMAWAALGGLMSTLYPARYRFSALAIAYSIAAVISGFIPAISASVGEATGNAWWHPAVVLIALSLVTLATTLASGRIARRVEQAEPEPSGAEAISSR